MKVGIFGTGYVGLVTGACFAAVGHHVICADIDEARINELNQAQVPIFEPGLRRLLKKNLAAGRLSFTTSAEALVEASEVIFIAVGTPPREDGSADLSAVFDVAETIAVLMQAPKVIVNKSTSPVGTVDEIIETVERVLMERGAKLGFDVASNPEFLKEGAAIADCMKPDRIVLGVNKDSTEMTLRHLYEPFTRNHEKIMMMDPRSAELTKYAANAMLATKISFMNEMSQIAERVGADIENVRRGIGSDNRIGYSFIYPGCGYGGSCFPKDVKALAALAKEYEYDTPIISSVDIVNTRQKTVLADKLDTIFDNDLRGKTIAIWGVTFKPKTDDLREAPSLSLIETLWDKGASVRIYDPEGMSNFRKIYGDRDDYVCCESPYEALENADALSIVTEWNCFRSPDFDAIRDKLNQPIIVDGRNMYDPVFLQSKGISYYSIGRRA